ncbi:uncharacterized protein LOC127094461 [Lathyrus oleraceus]|uniref:uncharacterized protein LOC127094461 n=1 Tax=Pisum sativum TaxID=3888 RepID=UPI0021D3011E|nr:uncharacterized protein LOC127094461 [Pisum sativum]
MVEGCLGKYRVFDVNLIRRSLVEMHASLCELIYYEHDHASCQVFSRDPRGCAIVKRDLQEMLDQNLIRVTRDRKEDEHEVNVIVPHFNIPKPVVIAYDGQETAISPLVIHLTGHMPYEYDKVAPYKYNVTTIEDGKEVPIPAFPSIVNTADISGVTGSVIAYSIQDIRVIPTDEFRSPREALQKVIEQAYVDHDVTINKFDGIVANITACNNLSFSDEELPEQGRNHNLALHISINGQEDALSNVMVDTGSSLNVLPKSTLSKVAYQGAPVRFNGVVVKAFDGLRKTVIGEVDLPIKICPCLFHITFQVMNIHPAYSCLLGSPWIHQKLKFVKNGKLVVVGGEQAMLVSHLSSFSYTDVDEAGGMSFQALSIDNVAIKKSGESMSSLKDAQFVVDNGQSAKWGQIIELAENKNIAGLGFSPSVTRRDLKRIQEVFHSIGFIYSKD